MTAALSTELTRALHAMPASTLRARARFDIVDYHRERIACGHDYELWLLSWLPGQCTTVHDHGGAAGACVLISGRMVEERYTRRRDNTVVRIGSIEHRPDRPHVVAADTIHRVRAQWATVSLHLYIPGAREGVTYSAAA